MFSMSCDGYVSPRYVNEASDGKGGVTVEARRPCGGVMLCVDDGGHGDRRIAAILLTKLQAEVLATAIRSLMGN